MQKEYEYKHKWYLANWERLKARRDARVKADPVKYQIRQLTSGWRKAGLKLTFAEFEVLRDKQNNLCAICGNKQNIKFNHLCVDHIHGTSVIRGLLCHNCNLAIGLLKDKKDTVMSMYRYLKENQNDHLL